MQPTGDGARLTIECGDWRPREGELRLGDSVCVQGVCLTLASRASGRLTFDVVGETLRSSTLGSLGPGAPVNLEPALCPTTPLGGHMVQGHVDGVGEVAEIRVDPKQWRLRVRPPTALMRYMAPKGSVAIEGVSLTLAAVDEASIEVAIIPTTLRETTLGSLKRGDRVNLETDMIARIVVNWLEHQSASGDPGGTGGSGGVTRSMLRDAGFGG